VIRTGEGLTAADLYALVRDCTKQKACSESFIKKAAGRTVRFKTNETTGEEEEDTDTEEEGVNHKDDEQEEYEEEELAREGIEGAAHEHEG